METAQDIQTLIDQGQEAERSGDQETARERYEQALVAATDEADLERERQIVALLDGLGTLPLDRQTELSAPEPELEAEREPEVKPEPAPSSSLPTTREIDAPEERLFSATRTATEPAMTYREPSEMIRDKMKEAEYQVSLNTNEGFKRAIATYQEVLRLGPVNPDAIRDRLDQAEKERERYLAQFGALITARQLKQYEQELEEIDKLIRTGRMEGPEGEDLTERQAEVLASLLRRSQESAQEHLSYAQESLQEACYHLSDELFALASERIDEVLDLKHLPDETRRVARGEREQVIKLRTYAQGVATLLEKGERALDENDYRKALRFFSDAQRRGTNPEGELVIESVRLQARIQTAQESWEAIVLPEMQKKMDDANRAKSEGKWEDALNALKDLLKIEPDMQTENARNLRKDAESLRQQIVSISQRTSHLVTSAQQALREHQLGEARRLAEEAMIADPHSKEANRVHKQVVWREATIALNEDLSEARQYYAQAQQCYRDKAYKEAEEALQEALRKVSDARNHLGDVSEDERPEYEKRLDWLASDVEEKRKDLDHEINVREKARGFVDQAQGLIKAERYEQAIVSLDRAREVDPENKDAPRALELAKEGWARQLKKDLEAAMKQEPPLPEKAIQYADRIADLGYEDVGVSELRRLARYSIHSGRGRSLLKQGRFAEAIEELEQADPQDRQVIEDLRLAYRREGDRLAAAGEWIQAIACLEQVAQYDPQAEQALQNARFERLMVKVQEALDGSEPILADEFVRQAESMVDDNDVRKTRVAKSWLDLCAWSRQRRDFDRAHEALGRAEPVAVGSAHERLAAERQMLTEAEALHVSFIDSTERARELMGIGDLDALDTAIKNLQDLQPRLPSGDDRHPTVQRLLQDARNQFQRLASTAVQDLLNRARLAAQDGRNREALRLFDRVLKLQPNQSEVMEERSNLVRVIDKENEELVREAESLLKSRRAKMPLCKETLSRVDEALEDNPGHSGLRQIKGQLLDMQEVLSEADKLLTQARKSWLGARRRRSDTAFLQAVKDAEYNIERAQVLFSDRTCRHYELDETDRDSLVNQIKSDKVGRASIARWVQEANKGLENEDASTARRAVESLLEFDPMDELGHALNIAAQASAQQSEYESRAKDTTDFDEYNRLMKLAKEMRELALWVQTQLSEM